MECKTTVSGSRGRYRLVNVTASHVFLAPPFYPIAKRKFFVIHGKLKSQKRVQTLGKISLFKVPVSSFAVKLDSCSKTQGGVILRA